MIREPIILVVDDEAQIRRLLLRTLDGHEWKILEGKNGAEALTLASTHQVSLVILDLGLPDMDGADVLRRLREWSKIPVIIVSVRNAETDIIACLDAGADDYLTKPFRTGELLARVRTALRRSEQEKHVKPYVRGEIVVDLEGNTARKRGEFIKLTGTEFSLLSLFVRHAGRVLTHRFILEQVWGQAYAEETQYTRVYVGSLRKKLEDDPSKPSLIITESGIGYRMVEGDEPS